MGRPDAINLSNSNEVNPPTSDEYKDYLARMVQVLDRGHVIDRFRVPDAAPGVHYEWHKDDPYTHARLTQKGFVIDDDLAKTSGFVHTDGAGNARIADVRCYSIPKWKHEVLQKIEEEAVKRAQDPRRADRDFLTALEAEGGYSEKIAETSDSSISGLELATSLKEK